jgi:hypothetical protein
MRVVPRKTIWPPVDFRSSILPMQSALVKPCNDKEEPQLR